MLSICQRRPTRGWSWQHRDALQRSFPLILTTHCTVTPLPRQGQLQEDPTLSGIQAAPTLRPTLSHQDVRLPSGFLNEILRMSNVVRCVLLHKHLLMTPLMILVPNKLGMGTSGTRPSLARQDNQPRNQPFSEHCTDRLSQTRRRLATSFSSTSRRWGSTFPIFESYQQ